ncbi:uncharacterized protein LOC132745493 [Ruditapes philippinarum]|uniref:uncharacterized protein LOC132745493 n=1 Tax=Ruditapes philippinarum TaxID=129788 RepID=UPI00295B5C22|nr:uncharacterized protein LOC132745493 [Ruditapes philippinarum]
MAGKDEDGEQKRLVKISELPVYGNPEVKIKLLPEEIGKFRECISEVRKTVADVLSPFQGTVDKTKHIIETGEAHTKSSLNQIRSDEGLLTKLTVIGLSGLAGNILAMRGSESDDKSS